MLPSSVGKKIIVTVTGLLLLGFVIGHLLGNLQIFLGQDAINLYAKKLKSMPLLLWSMRIGLLTIFVTHIITAIHLAIENKRARPIPYAKENTVKASYASRFMVLSGTFVLLYVIFHLAHFTVGVVHSEYFHLVDYEGRHDVYSMIVYSFKDPMTSILYIASMALLCFHLKQAAAAFPQTLGLSIKNAGLVQLAGNLLAYFIFFGYISIPVAVLLGVVKPVN